MGDFWGVISENWGVISPQPILFSSPNKKITPRRGVIEQFFMSIGRQKCGELAQNLRF